MLQGRKCCRSRRDLRSVRPAGIRTRSPKTQWRCQRKERQQRVAVQVSTTAPKEAGLVGAASNIKPPIMANLPGRLRPRTKVADSRSRYALMFDPPVDLRSHCGTKRNQPGHLQSTEPSGNRKTLNRHVILQSTAACYDQPQGLGGRSIRDDRPPATEDGRIKPRRAAHRWRLGRASGYAPKIRQPQAPSAGSCAAPAPPSGGRTWSRVPRGKAGATHARDCARTCVFHQRDLRKTADGVKASRAMNIV